MDPSGFQFKVTMPGDTRLVGAVRELASQAASYVKLSAEAGRSFADHVVHCTERTIESTHRQDAPIEFRFDGDEQGLNVTISADANASSSPPGPSAAGDLSVNWSREGSRQTCRIRHRLA
jgi:hypothetical protein